jgi:hypothetical protein
MRLVGSSDPSDVERDTAVRLLAERATLTRAICRELVETGSGFADRRPSVAMSLLLRWIVETMPECLQYRGAAGNLCVREPRPSDGIDQMIVPAGCEDLLFEIRDGAAVGDALFMLFTADTPTQQRGDEARIRERLNTYWANHSAAVRAPSVVECWSGFSTRRAESDATPNGGM